MVATGVLAYLLLDILLLLFIGIVVAAALRPWHVMLCRRGVPKALAVLLIYLFLLIGLVLIALVVGPVLRTSRMGIDLATADHVVDEVDKRIEVAVARVEKLISVAEEPSEPLAAEAQATIVEKLQGATEQIEQAVERVDTIVVPAEDALGTSGPTVGLALAEPSQAMGQGEQAVEPVATAVATTTETQGPVQGAEPEAIVDNLDQAAQRFKEAVQDVETLVVAAPEEAREAHAAEEVRHVRKEIEQAIRPKRD